jgi:steroid delta-isomerase-like uncharacterized protein
MPPTTADPRAIDPRELARRSFEAIESGEAARLEDLVHPEYRNWEAEGPGAPLRGAEAFAATIQNLNTAFSELRFEVERVVAEGDTVAVATVMHGVHTGPMRNLPATGQPFAQRQSHWYRVKDGRLIEHWATRDDLGFMHQIGVAPAARVGQTAGAPPTS